MKAMILCAGLGTRLRPWTLEHPKALVPLGGIPMLRRVAHNLHEQGFDDIIVNVHHFADQILKYIDEGNLGESKVSVSDESDALLDTGGGILRAEPLLSKTKAPFMVHNVDILSNADLKSLYESHVASGRDVSLLVSDRKSSRKLIFEKESLALKGWINEATGETKPVGVQGATDDMALAFSGIYVMSLSVFDSMRRYGFVDKFSVMDFFLTAIRDIRIGGVIQSDLNIIDIGKPETLKRANFLFS